MSLGKLPKLFYLIRPRFDAMVVRAKKLYVPNVWETCFYFQHAVGRAVSSNIRGPRFEFSHRVKLKFDKFTVKMKIKEKEA